MSRRQSISIRNRQRVRRINLRRLREVVLLCMRESLFVESFELGIQIVDAKEMTKLNEQYLQHRGSTDVITFDYLEPEGPGRQSRSPRLCPEVGEEGDVAKPIHGDIFLCMDEANRQAREFNSSWQEEIVRYIIHGVLHLLGHDDRTAARRAKMKRDEDLVMRSLDRMVLRRWLNEK